jgi:hypothetical protein
MLEEALNRTLLLMRTELQPDVEDATLLAALTGVRVVVVADQAALATHSGQSAYVTAALTMARSGHQIWLAGEETPLLRAQPPLGDGLLFERLLDVGRDLLPGREFHRGTPEGPVDLAILIGMPEAPATVRHAVESGPPERGRLERPFGRGAGSLVGRRLAHRRPCGRRPGGG